ncbi:hypothetical protein E3226_010875 [Legionella geestiana]|uniref:hypothetical protein n=1 Tax=Legionella geestiana TaxID=45065 RepID=UPI001091BEDB|nr:hypothetical protein [Legionella geestiana]QDQ40866.1 hypothetical protein E3226_010875 [Legionella geestiana]
MAASGNEVRKDFTIMLPEALNNKWESLIAVLGEINAMVQAFNRNDVPERIKHLDTAKIYLEAFKDELSDTLAAAQREKTTIIPEHLLSQTELQTKRDILLNMNCSAIMVANILSTLKFCLDNADRGIGACQELATVSFAVLTVLYGMGLDRGLSLELADIYRHHQSHMLVVINRNPESDLKNVSNWGEDCLIFDPLLKVLYCPATIPRGVTLSAFLSPSVPPGFTIGATQNNDLGLSLLSPWVDDEKFGLIVTESQKVIRNFFQSHLLSMLKPRMCDSAASVDKPGIFASQFQFKSSLVDYLEKISGLSFTGIKTKDWHTHHFALLTTENAEEKAVQLQRVLHGHGHITSLTGMGKVLFFANTNNDEGKALRDEVLSAMRAERKIDI